MNVAVKKENYKTSYINNRRYLGNKYKLLPFITKTVESECENIKSVADIFAGTGAVSSAFTDKIVITNDLMYSNYICNFAWFGSETYRPQTIIDYIVYYNSVDNATDNYMTENFADTYFSYNDCAKIGFIREDIELNYKKGNINDRERALLITSLLYDTGIGNDINFHTQNFIKINKDFNRRSMQEIIDVANIIRNDNITQCSIYEDCHGGSIKFYEGTSNQIDRFIGKYIKKWHINSENKLHCFVLTNNTVADYSGFSELYNAFKDTERYTGTNYKSLNTELLSDDIKKLGEVQLIFYKIIEIYTLIKKADTQIVDILPRELHRKINLGQLKKFVSTLKKVSGETMIEYISAIILEAQNDVTGIFEVFVRYIADIERISVDSFKQKITRILFPNEDDISSIEQKIETIFNIDLSVYELWYRFIKNEVNKNVVYHTYHSTKGLEFDNVIIIMENAFGRDKKFFDFYFSNYRDSCKLNETEKNKLQNIRNLLYVSLTRAVKNLRILYIDSVKDFKTNLEGIFGKVERIPEE